MKYGQKFYDDEKQQGTGLSPIGGVRRTVEKPGFQRQPTYQTMSESGQQEQQVDAPEVQQPQQPTTQAPSIDYNQQLNDLYQQIMNRQPFKFDLNEDALYQQLRESYIANGRLAMEDTMGQAATLTGGYGNSYAQGVGQQAYNQYLQGLTDEIPDLYQMALNNYIMEGDAMYDQLAALQWKAEFDEDKRRYDQAWEQEYGTGTDGNSGGSGGSGGGGGGGGGSQEPEAELSAAGQAFLQNVPYLHAGGDVEGWKRTVAGMLYRALENGTLTDTDAAIIALQLGLEDIDPDMIDPPKQGSSGGTGGGSGGGGGGGGGSRHEMISWG